MQNRNTLLFPCVFSLSLSPNMAWRWQFAPWCVWCVKLAPTWEAFAEEAERELGSKLVVAKVRCVCVCDWGDLV